MKINPRPVKFIIFSGGGGVIERVQKVSLVAGVNQFEINNVPAAFDPSTTTAFFPGNPEGVHILQVDVKRPDKQIVENFINREKNAAGSIISNATDLRGANRDQIIELIESAYYRRYEDMSGTIVVSLESKAEKEIDLGIRYFLEDTRIKWEPSLHIMIDEKTKTARVEGFILAMNNTDHDYPPCEMEFAEFDMQTTPDDEGFLYDLEQEQMAQNIMPANRMMKNLKKLKHVLK
ncbi:MAG: hypothetical protein ACTSU9_01175 [Promethearchaeota archaeon]